MPPCAYHRRSSVVPALVLAIFLFWLSGSIDAASLPPPVPQAGPNDFQNATIVDVQRSKRIVPNGRWFAVHQFTIELTVKMGGQNYEGEFDTVVVDLVHELESSKGQTAQVRIKGKEMEVKLVSGHSLKAHLISK
ncbi:MAG TPA: hypothetical protein VEG30_11675 [Terriglobales bacterium]|nr:hypothetical protein [Terriglobales bacterium]